MPTAEGVPATMGGAGNAVANQSPWLVVLVKVSTSHSSSRVSE
jgi:hypothetical protein